MPKKASNDYLQFISDCSEKSNEKYKEATKKGSTCNLEYNRLHKNKKKDVNEVIIKELIEPTKPKTKGRPKKTVSFVEEPVKPKKSKTKKPKQEPKAKKTKAKKPKAKKPKVIKEPSYNPIYPKEYIQPVKIEDFDDAYDYELDITPETDLIEFEDEPTPYTQKGWKEKYPDLSKLIDETQKELADEPIELSEAEIMGMGYNNLSEMEVYKNYPEVQYSPRVFGNGYGYNTIFKKYPDIQNVDIYGIPKHNNFYGIRNQPLKFENPYKGSGVSGNGVLNTAVVIEGLEKTGLIQASKDVLKSLTSKFDDWLSNPSATRQHRIISRMIPDLTYKYNKLKNELEVYGKSWKPLRINNHKLSMLNIEDKINSLLMELEVL